jgi:aflatoxin B1 aldehyde reductase
MSTIWTKDNITKGLKLLKSYSATIDTAQAYPGNEARMGELRIGTDFGITLNTKWRLGFVTGEGPGTREAMFESAKASLEKLQVPQVDIFYIHGYDETWPLEPQLAGMDDAYKAGYFKRFGLSNWPADAVKKAYDICKKNNYPLPTVFQGNYNAISRRVEDELFPTLRELGIAFNAYSPIAGGFLTKTREQIAKGGTRFDKDQIRGIYHTMYNRETFLDVLDDWHAIAKREGLSFSDLAYRWICLHSKLDAKYGDGVVFGAKGIQQLEQTLEACTAQAPLSSEAVRDIDDIWQKVKEDAFLDNLEALHQPSNAEMAKTTHGFNVEADTQKS